MVKQILIQFNDEDQAIVDDIESKISAENTAISTLTTSLTDAGVADASFTNPDQVVIDVGINVLPDGSICGDVCFDEVEPKVRAISPVPSGVGSVTTAVLCKHVIEAAEKTLQETLTERRTP